MSMVGLGAIEGRGGVEAEEDERRFWVRRRGDGLVRNEKPRIGLLRAMAYEAL